MNAYDNKKHSATTAKANRANGRKSREMILHAACEIASERGYDGTSISRIVERSGLPASSIYWHFKDKDQLITAVVERSYSRWLKGASSPDAAGPEQTGLDRMVTAMAHAASALVDSSHFLRLGLMLTLEGKPDEPAARQLFLQIRKQVYKQMVAAYEDMFEDELDQSALHALITLCVAAGDGLFVARMADNISDAQFRALFELIAPALQGAAAYLAAANDRSGAHPCELREWAGQSGWKATCSCPLPVSSTLCGIGTLG